MGMEQFSSCPRAGAGAVHRDAAACSGCKGIGNRAVVPVHLPVAGLGGTHVVSNRTSIHTLPVDALCGSVSTPGARRASFLNRAPPVTF